MVETFVRCMENRSDVAALSCYNIIFKDEEEIKLEEYLSDHAGSIYMTDRCYRPFGPCLPSLLFENLGRESAIGCYLYILSAYATWGVARWEKEVQSLDS